MEPTIYFSLLTIPRKGRKHSSHERPSFNVTVLSHTSSDKSHTFTLLHHPIQHTTNHTSTFLLPFTPATASPPNNAARASSKTVAPAPADAPPPPAPHAPPPPPLDQASPCGAPTPLFGPRPSLPLPDPLPPFAISKPWPVPHAGPDDAPSPAP